MDFDVVCLFDYDLVCGCNGIIYFNVCCVEVVGVVNYIVGSCSGIFVWCVEVIFI